MAVNEAKYHKYLNAGLSPTAAAELADDSNQGGSISVTDGITTVDPATSLVLPKGTLSDLGAGVSGVGLLLNLLGPFHIDYSSPLINSDFTVLGPALPDKAFVLSMWALFPTGWKSDSGSDCDVRLRLASLSPYATSPIIKEYPAPGVGTYVVSEPIPTFVYPHVHGIPAGTDAAGGDSASADIVIDSGIGIIDYAAWSSEYGAQITAIQLAIEVYANAGTSIVQGSADIYAIIATPSA